MHKIVETFDLVTPESAENVDYADNGWIDEEGVTPDEGENPLLWAVAYLRGKYATETSASFFCPGIWYSTYPESDYRDGSEETRSFHLKGFTEEEEEAVYALYLYKKNKKK